MYSPIFLHTENQLNKILKAQKRTKTNVNILFVSLWDKTSDKIIEALKKERQWHITTEENNEDPLYIANSFMMPHSFVIFRSFKLPHLVKMRKDSILSEYYLPRIYKELGL